MTTYKTGYDINGNKIVRVIPDNGRGFSIQTNGNLPNTHRDGVWHQTPDEVTAYVKAYGTKRQKGLLGIA